jgi:hypothetical protein
MPSYVINHIGDPQFDLKFQIQEAVRLKTIAYNRKKTAEKSGNEKKYEKEEKDENTFKSYRKKLINIQKNIKGITISGTGMSKFKYGKYLIDKKKLGKGLLSISYPNGKKVNGYPNMKVSGDVKKVLLNNKINKNYTLTEEEK